MATDDKDDVRDNGADATENTAGDDESPAGDAGDASKAAGDESKAAGDESKAAGDESKAASDESKTAVEASKTAGDEGKTAGERSAEKHEGERSAAEEHLAKKERTEKAFGAAKSSDKREHDPDHAHGAGQGGHASKHYAPNRKEYMVIFLVLFVLTVLEVAVAQVPGIAKTLLGVALVALAVTKAAFVGLFYMHLKHETNVLKLTVAIPLAAPAVYALVLIAEAAWRLTRQ